MMMATNADIHTLAAPYALHALPDEDVELFEEHLAECSACAAEVEEIRETAARLGAAAAVSPPARMKDDVLRRIEQVRPLPPEVTDSGDDDRDTLRSGARRRAWRRWWGPIATGAVAALLAGIVVLGIQLNETREQLDRSQAIGAQMRELVTAPDMQVVQAEQGDSGGTVIMARSVDTAVLMVHGMEPAPAEHTYQLWFIDDDGARSAGLLGDTEDGRIGPFTAHGLADADHLGITVEPAGGSERPTTDPVMLIELA
ncbi:anti-sigma factor [Phytoactinopolyspora halotolerans]|uniref:Regulator of SigK n=1 Tax=Phytoactinopolyspora halotolerans TaxID=1981512 RepID=A0A6L9S294_9ACTN|nr:anti-sigma factor [Phytoactinopolyspora halotolerans]NED98910.1 anti-sigma factor [Phytoactinopolyspora halotolerans]